MHLFVIAALMLGGLTVPWVASTLLERRDVVMAAEHGVACALGMAAFARIAWELLPAIASGISALGAACVLTALFCDMKARIIPWEPCAVLLGLGITHALCMGGDTQLVESLALAGILSGGSLAINYIAARVGWRQPLGMGDIRLMPGLCLFSGANGIAIGLFGCSILMGVAALIALANRHNKATHLPMAPGLVAWYVLGIFGPLI